MALTLFRARLDAASEHRCGLADYAITRSDVVSAMTPDATRARCAVVMVRPFALSGSDIAL